MDAAGHERFAYCGLSLGRMIGQWLGANAAGRIERLVLANTSPRMADPSLFDTRRATVLEQGMRAVQLPATHLSNVERPASFTAALFDFLLPATPEDTLEAGFAVRRAVLGDAHVDRSIAAVSGFTRDFQEMITRYAWGTVWTRPGLDPRIRRLLVLAMTASLGRWGEFRLHVRTGLAGELEMDDFKEVLMQVAVYAGVPAANTGFHAAADEQSKQGSS
jgi:3-oxoadipate enol-lactonase/4-carboxymuconolactone decarboxylase